MYKLVVFTHKEEIKRIVKDCISFLGLSKIEIYDIPAYRVEDHIESNTIVITFGKRAAITTRQHIESKKFNNVKHIELPATINLIGIPENKKHRHKTFNKLVELKELIESNVFQPEEIIIKEGDIPKLNERHILMLQKMTEDTDQESCFQIIKGNKLIEIGFEKQKDTKADMYISFKELYIIKMIMNILKVKEVTIVDKADSI